MHAYDVFNGDADGICALHQLRLAQPRQAHLITGVKRDISLLQQLPVDVACNITVLDISLDKNVIALLALLRAGSQVNYFDHHAAQHVFIHPSLRFFWNDAPQFCTSRLVDDYLKGQFRAWAIVGAFGDNLSAKAREMAKEMRFSDQDACALETLGRLLNYNAYGQSIEDLHIAPTALYQSLHEFLDPFDFIHNAPAYDLLNAGYTEDICHMNTLQATWESACGAVYVLPDQPWAHRISGLFANQLGQADDGRSYAVLTEKRNGNYLVSVRSGRPEVRAAHFFCQNFRSGGGRRMAAGINDLPINQLDVFVQTFSDYFSS